MSAGAARLPARLLVALVAVLAALAAVPALTAIAHADGDPGSDVLVYSNLFVGSDSGISVAQQEALGNLLDATVALHAPVRVAVVAHRDDLGFITALWGKPATYAKYLGYELSLAYAGRLLIVMPGGLGFYWNGHSDAPGYRALAGLTAAGGPAGLVAATETAVRRIERSAGVTALALAAAVRNAAAGAIRAARSASTPNGAIAPVPAAATAPAVTVHRSGGGSISGWVVALGLVLALSAPFWLPRVLRRRGERDAPATAGRDLLALARRRWALPGAAVLTSMVALVVAVVALNGAEATTPTAYLAHNPYVDPGTPLTPATPAPGFKLTDQVGREVSLAQFRGKVVILAFNDAECQTICPLTTQAMLDAKRALGPAGADVQLLGIDANSKSTQVEDVLSYTQLHGMTGEWDFLTGPLARLEAVWHAYGVWVDIERGLISHIPAVYVIDPQGRMRWVHSTQDSYAAIPQLGQVLARETSQLLPGHPAVNSRLSYATIGGITPRRQVSLPRSGGGTVQLGPGRAHLYLFFATWDRESTAIAGRLELLRRYSAAAAARRSGLPPLTAVDEGSVEPSVTALPAFLRTLGTPLNYPVAIDTSGRVADGYEVQGQPWFVLTSPSGRIAWWQEVYSSGWPSVPVLENQVRAALAKVSGGPVNEQAAQLALRGSPAPLAALHAQASQLVGGQKAMDARVGALRGYPILVNVWQSACEPCQAEFGLMANAAARFGKRIAFLGADMNDVSGNALAFLHQHAVSYPSYTATSGSIESLLPAGIEGLPTTFFINANGKVVFVHDGEYDSAGTLDNDIESYLLLRPGR